MKFRFIIILFVASCSVAEDTLDKAEFTISDQSFEGKVIFQPLAGLKGFKIILTDRSGEKLDQTIFKYSPYQFDTVDIDHDGKTEILIGLIKSTTFDREEKKRLFILRIDEGQLRPLWLGSKVCQELINFKAMDNETVQTLEKTKTGNYAIGLYEWQGFGLTLINYTHNEKTYDDAVKIFAN